ncbi:tripartite ATP-independent periplasmic transporter solute receptor, DctP family [Desulfitobacterium dehalogenans ATCC 51507]|uniref:Tripartite ATP-independent periplasmic transporter solute receptor, DctP family n=1 Tax=Desulfitobacterium dehalogenans (strain ATCC 51507 / DSM 9161 / JW/IU-DC1) TaxID=756499 RepID=I4AE49_DESDJ|nr:TRAP transporter substrate-binding protein [Desulfitobacterium dehalogenans]AFM02234.1 tripartite ATP-independent periplasmic transporter solute receptor, DctP family [Desulfitobacterium dehalogenans ATCC 51507]
MQKGIFLRKLVVVALVAGLSLVGCGAKASSDNAGSGNEQKAMKMRLTQTKSDNHPVSQGYVKFAELVKEKTNGQIVVDVFNNGVLGNDREGVEAAQQGTIEFGGSSTPNMSSFTNIFTAWDLPYIFQTKEDVYKAVDGEPGQLASLELEKSGFKVVMYPDYGFRQFVNNEREVKLPGDMKSLKVRTTNSPVEQADYKAWGANPTPIGWTEVYTALQQKTVDGEGNSYGLLWETKHQEVLKFASEINYNYSSDILVMNKKIFDGLSPELQKAILDAGKEAVQWQRELANVKEEEAKENFKNFGIKIYEPTSDEMKQWKESVKPVWDEFVVKGKADPEYVDLVLKTIGKTKEDIFQ